MFSKVIVKILRDNQKKFCKENYKFEIYRKTYKLKIEWTKKVI